MTGGKWDVDPEHWTALMTHGLKDTLTQRRYFYWVQNMRRRFVLMSLCYCEKTWRCVLHTHTQVKTHSVYLNLFLFVFLIYICLCVCADCSVWLSLTPKKIQLEIKLTWQSELPCCLEAEITFQQFLSLTSRHTDVHWWWKSARKDKKKKKFNLLKHVLKAVIKVKTITLNQLHLCFHFPHS